MSTEKSYIFTGDTKQYCGHTLKRIMATAANRRVSEGTLGGWIESESNLGDGAWVADEAMVFDDAIVVGSATVRDHAKVYGEAEICESSMIQDNAEVYGNAYIYGSATVQDKCKVYGYAKVYDFAEMSGHAVACEEAKVHGLASVQYNAVVRGNADVFDRAVICECASVRDNATVCDRAVVGAATVGGNVVIGGSAEIKLSAVVNNAVGYNTYRYVDGNNNVRLLTYTESNKNWVTEGFEGNSAQLLEFADLGIIDYEYTLSIIEAQSRIGNDSELAELVMNARITQLHEKLLLATYGNERRN